MQESTPWLPGILATWCAVLAPISRACSSSPFPPLPPHPAATLLGEVRSGGAAELTFEQAGSGDAQEGGGGSTKGGLPGSSSDMEAAMVRLIQQRARKYEQDKAVRLDTFPSLLS